MLKKARLARNLTQLQLATLLDCSQTAVSHWESGVSEPPDYVLRFFGLPGRATAKHLKTFREHYNLTQAQAASIACATVAAWGTWERGVHKPPRRLLDQLRKYVKANKREV